jgi:hypothetical protein
MTALKLNRANKAETTAEPRPSATTTTKPGAPTKPTSTVSTAVAAMDRLKKATSKKAPLQEVKPANVVAAHNPKAQTSQSTPDDLQMLEIQYLQLRLFNQQQEQAYADLKQQILVRH